MRLLSAFAVLFSIFLLLENAADASCQRWSAPQQMSTHSSGDGMSGLAASVVFPGTYYHANDQPRRNALPRTTENGERVGSVNLTPLLGATSRNQRDIESVAVGPCHSGESTSCL